MVELIMTLLALVPVNNMVLTGVKYLSSEALNKRYLRVVLGVASFMGVIASASLFGTPVDFDSLSEIGKVLAETLGLAFASHYSYRMSRSV